MTWCIYYAVRASMNVFIVYSVTRSDSNNNKQHNGPVSVKYTVFACKTSSKKTKKNNKTSCYRCDIFVDISTLCRYLKTNDRTIHTNIKQLNKILKANKGNETDIRSWNSFDVINKRGRKSAPQTKKPQTKDQCLTTKLALSRVIIKNIWLFCVAKFCRFFCCFLAVFLLLFSVLAFLLFFCWSNFFCTWEIKQKKAQTKKDFSNWEQNKMGVFTYFDETERRKCKIMCYAHLIVHSSMFVFLCCSYIHMYFCHDHQTVKCIFMKRVQFLFVAVLSVQQIALKNLGGNDVFKQIRKNSTRLN